MAQDFARQFYHSPRWRRNQKLYMSMVIDTPSGPCPPYVCERCFERGEIVPAKVVHHRQHLTPYNINDPNITLAFSNMQRLCQDCHAFVHSNQPEPRVTFDENGDVQKIDESFQSMVMRATETVDESRNIYKERS